MTAGVVIIGGGGHAKVVIESLRASGKTVAAIVDADATPRQVLGVPVVGDDAALADLKERGFSELFVALGSNRLRQKLGAEARELGFTLVNAIHPSAVISPSAKIGEGVALMAGVAINADSRIGDLAIVRVSRMTPGHMPGEGHGPEGPPFHDCGMHYVDVARWYSKSEYKTWHAQGIRMWAHEDPWWVQAHGTFENGVVFDITQGFVYGHLAQEKTHNCYVDLIGTRGICRMRHDFQHATIECHGINTTLRKTALFNDKKLDVMCDVFARSILAGKNMGLPTARDSAIASEVAWAMLHDAVKNGPPVVGTKRELKQIQEHRKSLRSGFGLPVRPQDCPAAPTPVGLPEMACGEDLCNPEVWAVARADDRQAATDLVSHPDGPMGL